MLLSAMVISNFMHDKYICLENTSLPFTVSVITVLQISDLGGICLLEKC